MLAAAFASHEAPAARRTARASDWAPAVTGGQVAATRGSPWVRARGTMKRAERRRAKDRTPRNATPAALSAAIRCHRAGDLDAAERAYAERLRVRPDDP